MTGKAFITYTGIAVFLLERGQTDKQTYATERPTHARHAMTQLSKGQRSKSQCYENGYGHGRTVASGRGTAHSCAVLLFLDTIAYGVGRAFIRVCLFAV